MHSSQCMAALELCVWHTVLLDLHAICALETGLRGEPVPSPPTSNIGIRTRIALSWPAKTRTTWLVGGMDLWRCRLVWEMEPTHATPRHLALVAPHHASSWSSAIWPASHLSVHVHTLCEHINPTSSQTSCVMYAVTTRDDAKHVSRIRQGSTQRTATSGRQRIADRARVLKGGVAVRKGR
jgi:hypothetical protein